jgi:serine/threonine protein kinase
MNETENVISIIEKIYEGPQTNVFRVLFNEQECILKELTNSKVYKNEIQALERIVEKKIKGCVEWFLTFDTILVIDKSKNVTCLGNVIILPLLKHKEVNFDSIESFKKYIYSLASITRDLHRAGVYHIDIKPQNFLVDLESSTFHLIDFSHSYTINDSISTQRTFNLKGTSYYTCPEIKFRKKATKKNKIDLEKIDVWAIAMTCLVLLNQSKYILSIGNVQTGEEGFEEHKKFFGLEFFSWFEIKKELSELGYCFEMDYTWNKLPFFYDTNLYGISDEMKIMLEGMLEINPNKRWSLDKILASPFFSSSPNLALEKLNYFTVRQYFVQEKAFTLTHFNIKRFFHHQYKKKYETSANFAERLSENIYYSTSSALADNAINVVEIISIGGFLHECTIPLIFNRVILNSCITLFYGKDTRFYVNYDTFNLFCAMALNNMNLFKLIN